MTRIGMGPALDDLWRLPKPDPADPYDLVVVQKADVNGVDAQAVGQDVVAERIVTDDALTLRINSGQPNDVTQHAGHWQLRVVEVGAWREHHAPPRKTSKAVPGKR